MLAMSCRRYQFAFGALLVSKLTLELVGSHSRAASTLEGGGWACSSGSTRRHRPEEVCRDVTNLFCGLDHLLGKLLCVTATTGAAWLCEQERN